MADVIQIARRSLHDDAALRMPEMLVKHLLRKRDVVLDLMRSGAA
jgi:hypothetical protein